MYGYYEIKVEGEKIRIEISKHAMQRCLEREVSKYVVYSLILKLGDSLLDLKNGEQFAIIDKEAGVGIINQITCDAGEIFIDVVTVISNERIWMSRGTKVLNVNNVFSQVA